MSRLSIVVLTLNEAHNIDACLRSAQGVADQILVVDSGSQDATVSLAQGLGAQVVAYPDWQGFGEQRSRALQHVQADWVFFLDADERLTPALADEIRQVVADNAEAVWEVEWEQMAYGQSLGRMRGTGGVARLFPMRVLEGFSGAVHEGAVLRTAVPTRHLRQRLPHFSRETIYGSLVKLAQYVQLGALKRHQAGKRGGVLRGLGSGMANFTRLYVFQRGFLCGRAGFLYSFFVGLECFFRYVALEVDRDQLKKPVRR
ncbi:glycosyltransferase family 2 protein [Comamonas sp. UBA7528]|uniref:glycosyltransferase family 2 protein n=1 Tax=Comamonas sp. UBA7528 TaxID=1946391 RepID=UPI0025BCD4B7|nr:glycosyltransferase family 2 protein [Comamonas sp. UBA7528]